METKKVLGGTVHSLPTDVRETLLSHPKVLALWQSLTPLARNEWICWITSGKKAETRDIRIKKGLSKLAGGMRRPCCWVGCTHRVDKPLSSSQKFVLRSKLNK